MIRLLLAATAIGLYLVISTHDYNNEVIAERAYITDVCSGVYPDYKNLNPKCSTAERSKGDLNEDIR